MVGPEDGRALDLDGLGVRFLVDGGQTARHFALVEHPLAARTLGAAVHTHTREDEYSFVLEGRVGLQIGDHEIEAGPGDLVLKPRGVPHAFWNATDAPARLLEIISPAGFERFFDELGALMAHADEDAVEALLQRYGIAMDFESGRVLAARHGLRNEF